MRTWLLYIDSNVTKSAFYFAQIQSEIAILLQFSLVIKEVCQNVHLLFLSTKPRLSQAGALLLPKDFVSLGIRFSL